MNKACGIFSRLSIVMGAAAVYYLLARLSAYVDAVQKWNIHKESAALFEDIYYSHGWTPPSLDLYPAFWSVDIEPIHWFFGFLIPIVTIGLVFLTVIAAIGVWKLIQFIAYGMPVVTSDESIEDEDEIVTHCHNAICQCSYHSDEWYDGDRGEWVNENDFDSEHAASLSKERWVPKAPVALNKA